jgi:MFS family permease
MQQYKGTTHILSYIASPRELGNMALLQTRPLGYRWRSSKFFILTCITLALFSENFLYSFIVPILQCMIEDRLHLHPSKAQGFTSAALSIHALVCFASGPVVGHLADKVSSRKGPLLLSVVGEIIGTILVAAAPSGMQSSLSLQWLGLAYTLL